MSPRSKPLNTAPRTVPSDFATTNAFVVRSLLRPQNIDTAAAVAPAFVHVHDLPVSVAETVDVPTSDSVAVAGAQLSVPRSLVCVTAAPVVDTDDANVPAPSA